MIWRNREQKTSFDIDLGDFSAARRKPGLSAFLRVKDEAEWLGASLASIVPWVDEIIIAVQGEQMDGTRQIAKTFAKHAGLPVKVLEYPFDSQPNGPGHDSVPGDSVHARSWFYNWTLAHTTKQWAMKWDGDMVAFERLAAKVHDVIQNGGNTTAVSFKGTDIVGFDLRHQAVQPDTPREPRVFKVSPHTLYHPGPKCEVMDRQQFVTARIDEPQYLHFKWAKPEESRINAWPGDWRSQPHFQKILRDKIEGDEYTGPWPEVMRSIVVARQNGSQ